MLVSLRSVKLPAPGGWGKIGGAGVLGNPGGVYATSPTARVVGDWIPGAIGDEWELKGLLGGINSPVNFRAELLRSLTTAEQATLINFGNCRMQLVQGLSSSTGAPTAGNLAFMSDRTTFTVTPDPDTNVGNAVGIYLWTPTNKGDYCLIVNLGDVEARCKATVTNASTAGKPVYAVSDSSLGKLDGLADATAVTNLILGTEVGKVIASLSNGGLVRTYLQPKLRMI